MTLFDERGGWPGVLGHLVAGRHLDAGWAAAALTEILRGDATPSQLTAFVVALRSKGETAEELFGMLDAVLDAATRVPLPDAVRARAVDLVGTGGDHSSSINVSTLSSLVVAACGVPVCKHGNRAASSQCGAADLLETLGASIELGPTGVAACVERVGFGFCFAPRFHPAFRHAGPSRREIGIRTAFNLLGPLANPSGLGRHLVGVATPDAAPAMVEALARRGATCAWVVHGHGGLDELSLAGPSHVWAYADGRHHRFDVDPSALGLTPAGLDAIAGGDPSVNARLARDVLHGSPGPHREVVLLNAAAGLVVAGAVDELADGIARAGAAIDGGAAAATLEAYVAETRRQAADVAR
jgi:anthranilate phosphoribosyltransferase